MKNLLTAFFSFSLCCLPLFAQDGSEELASSDLLDPAEVVDAAVPEGTKEAEGSEFPGDMVDRAINEEVLSPESTGVLQADTNQDRNWIDGTRDWLYGKSQGTVVWLDTGILKPGPNDKTVPTPPSRFRVGMYTQIDLKTDGGIKFAPVADFDVDVDLPNLESRLKLFISTKDPTALPGQDAFDSDNALRVGASRSLFKTGKVLRELKPNGPPNPLRMFNGPRNMI